MQTEGQWKIVSDISPGLYIYASDLNQKSLVVHTIYEPDDFYEESSRHALCHEISQRVDLSNIDIVLVQLCNGSWSAFMLYSGQLFYHDVSIDVENGRDSTDIALSLINTPSVCKHIRVH
ncbi:hypothetical protein ACEUAI_22935 [Aeromonas veronii]